MSSGRPSSFLGVGNLQRDSRNSVVALVLDSEKMISLSLSLSKHSGNGAVLHLICVTIPDWSWHKTKIRLFVSEKESKKGSGEERHGEFL